VARPTTTLTTTYQDASRHHCVQRATEVMTNEEAVVRVDAGIRGIT